MHELESGSLAELRIISDQLTRQHANYTETHLPTLVSKNTQLSESCDTTRQVVDKFLSLHQQLLDSVSTTDRTTQEASAWLSYHQRFGYPDNIGDVIQQIQVNVYQSLNVTECLSGHAVFST